jgi:hypothetical protein
MAHPVHEFAEVGPLLSDQLTTGVAQVVKVNLQARGSQRGEPDTAPEVCMPQRLAAGLVNSSVSAAGDVRSSRWVSTWGRITDGMATRRLPASDLGVSKYAGRPAPRKADVPRGESFARH